MIRPLRENYHVQSLSDSPANNVPCLAIVPTTIHEKLSARISENANHIGEIKAAFLEASVTLRRIPLEGHYL